MMSRENILNICKMIEDGSIVNTVNEEYANINLYFVHTYDIEKAMYIQKILKELANTFQIDWTSDGGYYRDTDTVTQIYKFDNGIEKFEITMFVNRRRAD